MLARKLMRSGLVLVLAVGCSSSGDRAAAGSGSGSGAGSASGAGERISTLSDSRVFSTLSRDEATQYCQDLASYRKKYAGTPSNLRVSCAGKALVAVAAGEPRTTEAIRAACKQAFEACLPKPPDPADEIDCSSSLMMEQMAGCKDLTVGDVTGCAMEVQARVATLAKQDACASLDGAAPNQSITTYLDQLKGERCAVVERKCKREQDVGLAPVKPGEEVAATAGSGSEIGAYRAQILARLDGFQHQMCACHDKACAALVDTAMSKWGQDLAQTAAGQAKPDEATLARSEELLRAYSECQAHAEAAR